MSPRRDRPAPDPRHSEAKHSLAQHWAAENPEMPQMPWSAADAGALAALLRANPALDVGTIRVCLHYRRLSEDHARGERVCRWIIDVLRYRSGPLDRYRLPKRAASEATIGMGSAPDSEKAAKMRDHFVGQAMKRHAAGDKLTELDQRLLREEGWL